VEKSVHLMENKRERERGKERERNGPGASLTFKVTPPVIYFLHLGPTTQISTISQTAPQLGTSHPTRNLRSIS
jgi:hypothetical protein